MNRKKNSEGKGKEYGKEDVEENEEEEFGGRRNKKRTGE